MIYCRLADAPEKIESEGNRLVQEYLSQFSDDDEIQTSEVYDYVLSHASRELRAYMDMVEKIHADAKRRGAIAG